MFHNNILINFYPYDYCCNKINTFITIYLDTSTAVVRLYIDVITFIIYTRVMGIASQNVITLTVDIVFL